MIQPPQPALAEAGAALPRGRGVERPDEDAGVFRRRADDAEVEEVLPVRKKHRRVVRALMAGRVGHRDGRRHEKKPGKEKHQHCFHDLPPASTSRPFSNPWVSKASLRLRLS